MKKQIFAVIAITVCTVCMFAVTSCKKDEAQSCTCTESDYGYSNTRQLDPASYGATNCSDLEVKLRMASNGEFDYNCH